MAAAAACRARTRMRAARTSARFGHFRHAPLPTTSRLPSVVRAGSVSMHDDVRAVGRARARQRRLELGDRLHVLGQRAQRARVRREVDRRRAVRALHAVVEQVVERRAADRLLQPVDAAVAAVVEHDDRRACGRASPTSRSRSSASDSCRRRPSRRLRDRAAPSSRRGRRRSRSPCTSSRTRRDSRRAPTRARACAARRAACPPRTRRCRRVGESGDRALHGADHVAVVGQLARRARRSVAATSSASRFAARCARSRPRRIGAPAVDRASTAPRARGPHRRRSGSAAPLQRVERVDVDR